MQIKRMKLYKFLCIALIFSLLLSVYPTTVSEAAAFQGTYDAIMTDDAEASSVSTVPISDPTQSVGSKPIYALVGTSKLTTDYITADGENYKITVTCDENAGIPADAVLAVREITETSDETEYGEYLTKLEDTLEETARVTFARFFDITILSGGEEIQPLSPVEVTIELADAQQPEEASEACVVHFGEEAEVLESTVDETIDGAAITFETEGFSVFGIVYTVDFEYSVNGEVYDFSLPGGEKIALSQLIEVLGVIRGTQFSDAAEFIKHVRDVEFSDTSLVTVTPVKEGGFLGIGAKTVDWELTSLQAFDTEEMLTITMDNGDVVRVRVTDAQITKDILTASGETYTITVEYGDDAELPDNSDLNVTEITESSDYNKYLSDSASQLGVEDKDVTFARFFDIEIVDENGEKVEPKAPVQVKIAYKDAVDTSAFLHVVHFAEDGTEVIDNVTLSEDNKEITYEQGSFSVTGTIITGNPGNGTQNMVLVKYDGNYYIVNNDGSLTQVRYEDNKVYVENPMLWTYTGSNLYHDSIQVDFNSSQLASDFFYKYLDPSDASGIAVDDETNCTVVNGTDGKVVQNGSRTMMTRSALSYSGNHIKSNSGNSYLGVSTVDGELRLTGQHSAADAAEIYFASASNVARPSYMYNAVNHIDISIEGHASVDVPLAYGKYYDAEGNELKNVTSFEKLSLTEDQVEDKTQLGITTDDIKRSTISAYTMNGDTAVPLDDAFYITGYSANETTSYSTDQVRIEGSFKVADLDYEIDSTKYNGSWDGYNYTWPDQNYINKVHQDRLNNKVYYSVTAVKPITFNLVDPKKGQLYDSEGNKLTVTKTSHI